MTEEMFTLDSRFELVSSPAGIFTFSRTYLRGMINDDEIKDEFRTRLEQEGNSRNYEEFRQKFGEGKYKLPDDLFDFTPKYHLIGITKITSNKDLGIIKINPNKSLDILLKIILESQPKTKKCCQINFSVEEVPTTREVLCNNGSASKAIELYQLQGISQPNFIGKGYQYVQRAVELIR